MKMHQTMHMSMLTLVSWLPSVMSASLLLRSLRAGYDCQPLCICIRASIIRELDFLVGELKYFFFLTVSLIVVYKCRFQVSFIYLFNYFFTKLRT